MLNRKNLRIKRPMEKLDHKKFGPFVVKRKVGSRAYEVELPARWDIHPVFHVSLLEPYREDPVGRPQKMIPTPEIVDNEPSYVVACNDRMIGSYNHYHLSANGIPRGTLRWYGLVYFIQIAGKARIRHRQLLSSFEVL